jgi:hypothetical protein
LLAKCFFVSKISPKQLAEQQASWIIYGENKSSSLAVSEVDS